MKENDVLHQPQNGISLGDVKRACMHIRFYLFYCILLLSGNAVSQSFKTVGYLPYYRFAHVNEIDFEKLTHVNIAFANPDLQGNLSVGGADMIPVIQQVQAAGAEVFISLAGGALTTEWAAAWTNLTKPGNRSAFIHKIIRYTLDNGMQGIDVDLEWQHVDDNYSGFVLELRDSVDAHDLQLTAALPGIYRYPEITGQALAAYDWINMMVYDLTGPWAPNNPGPHSPFSFAVNATVYWVDQGVPPEKLTLGMPFYGWDFSDPSDVSGILYRTLVNQDPGNAYRDKTGLTYYNGIPTVRQKTEYAMIQLGGVMIWELGQDHFGQYSLLDQVDDVIRSAATSVENIADISINVFPNPFTDGFLVSLSAPENGIARLIGMQGNVISETKFSGRKFLFDPSYELPSGIYLLQLVMGDRILSQRVAKQ